jgi:putative inorganic carbon (HCO3(-)) transporter
VASVYALVQFISPPPWDAMWIYASGFLAAGLPYPYTLRAWGTMNSPGPFADFLVCTILLALPLVNWRKPLALVATLVCCIGLALTFVRANALVLGACLAIYLFFSPRRTEIGLGIGGIVLAVALVVGLAPTIAGETGTRFVDRLTDRFNTIDTLDTDVSVSTRQLEIEAGLTLAIAEPLGQGLGTIGTAAKLDGGQGEAITVDSGYVSRFEALGYLGMFGYLIVTIGGLARSLVQAIGVASQGERERAVVVVAAVTVQAALVAIDFAVDSHSAFDGILFWLALATAFGYLAPENATNAERVAPRPEPAIGRELSTQ